MRGERRGTEGWREGGREEGREGWSEGREEGGREGEGGMEGGRKKGGREEEGREGGTEGGNTCGVVLVVNIYYKLWKERHRTHNNGQRLVDSQLVHKTVVDVGPITFGTTSKLCHATLEEKPQVSTSLR